MGNDHNSMKAGEFRGRVLTSLEYIEKEIKAVKLDGITTKKFAGSNNKRIVKLEKKWAYALGLFSGISAVAGVVGGYLQGFLPKR